MLKKVLESLDGLDENVAKLYKQGDDGKYHLEVEGDEDPVALKSALQKEREARKAAEKKAKELEGLQEQTQGLDLPSLRKLAEQLDKNEYHKMIKEGRVDEALQKFAEKHIEKMKADFDKQLGDKDKAIEAAVTRAKRRDDLILEAGLREAAVKAGTHPSAIDDVVLHGRSMFSLDDDGRVVRIKDGEVEVGKDGKTPFGPSDWLESTREAKPHWYPSSGSGTGSGGNGTQRPASQTKGKAMKRAVFDGLGQNEKAQVIADGVAIVD